MTFKALILLVLLSQKPEFRDTETWEERTARLELVANAIESSVVRATCTPTEGGTLAIPEGCAPIWGLSQKSLAMLLITQAVSESTLAHRIHDNDCRLNFGECDPSRAIDPTTFQTVYTQRSFSLWQIRKNSRIEDAAWADVMKGREGTAQAAWIATRVLAGGKSSCGNIQGAISMYITGNTCLYKKAVYRFNRYSRLMNADVKSLESARAENELYVQSRPTPDSP